ncbi:hypothetical protein GIB67_019296, partial [Kingdonia uniflora]
KRKTIDPSTVVPPNTVDSANEGVSEGVNILTESAEGVNIPQGSEFETESTQAGLGAQPPLPNVCPDFDENIPIFGGYSEGEGATSNDDVGPSDKSLLRSFRFHRAKSIELGQEKLPIRVHHHQSMWGLRKEPQVDLNAFKSLKAGGAGNSLSLKKLKEYYAFKLEKVLSDGTAAAAKKKKGLTARSVARAYMLYVLGSFLFPTKKGTDVSARDLVLFAKDKVAKKWSWGSAVLAHMYYNLHAASRDDAKQFACFTTLLESWIFAHLSKLCGIPKEMDSDAYEYCTCWKWDVFVTDRYSDDFGIHQRKHASVNEHGDTPVHQSEDITKQYDASHHEHSSLSPNINLNDQQITALNDQLQKLKEDKREGTSECDLLKETIEQMKAEIELKRVVDGQCALEFTDLPRQLDAKCKEIESLKAVNTILMEQIDMQLPPTTPPVPDTTLAKKYEDLLAAHEDVKKKLIAKENFQQKLVNAEERMKPLKQITMNGREKMAKKKKMQEFVFQPWTKYFVYVRGVEISENNFGFRVTAAIQRQSQHRFSDVMKSLKTFLCKDPAFWKIIFSQTLGIQFTADGENAYQILLQACSYGHQHMEYRHMAHLLATYYEKAMVFISHTEAYIFLPLFWARKRNTTSNEERFQNLVMDIS